MKRTLVFFVVTVFLVNEIIAPPVDPPKKESENHKDKEAAEPDDLGLEYGRYLQQVIQALEEDKEFAKKLENVSADSIKSGDVAHELEFVNHRVRTKLDELKRMELDRYRSLIRLQQNDLGAFRSEDGRLNPPPGDGRQWRTLSMGDDFQRGSFKLPHHLDVKNPHTFEIEDLKKLIKTASKDLDDLNDRRKEEFKKYEMEKEHKRKEELKHMNEADRKAAELKHQEMVDKHRDHPQVHHPGSKQQLEQVWEEVDHLPRDEFDPKTFFRMHDINGDGYWDEEEVKALVALEVRKMYNISNIEDDPVEMQEEFARMEEHIFKEADKNHDRLITMEEFLEMTRKPDFEQDAGWKGLDEEQVYTPEELMEYERQLAAQAGYHPNMGYPGGYPQDPQAGYHPNQQYGNQQYGYQPVHGVPPSNQGVQFQPLPQHQGQQQQGMPQQYAGQQHPAAGQGQGQGQGYPTGQGQPMGQPPHPGQGMGQPPHPANMGQPMHTGQGIPPSQQQYGAPHGQPPMGGGPPPHYPPQYAPAGGPQYGGHPNQPPVQAVPPPQAQANQGNNIPPQQQAVPQQPPVPSGQVTGQPQVAQGGGGQQQVPQRATPK